MEMHPSAIKQMKKQLLEILNGCVLESEYRLEIGFFESTKKLTQNLLKSKGEWLTERNIRDQIYYRVLNAVKLLGHQSSDFPKALKELLNEGQLNSLGKEIGDFFRSIPRQHEIKIPFPAFVKEEASCDICFSKSISLRLEKEKIGREKIRVMSTILSESVVKKMSEVRYPKLIFSIKGYSDYSIESYSCRQALVRYKILAYWGIQTGLFEYDIVTPFRPVLGGNSEHTIRKKSMVAIEDDKIVSDIPMPLSLCSFIENLRFKNDERAEPTARTANYLSKALFLIESDEPEAERVKAAIEWAFDSLINENETLAFLQLCFGFEALLGEGENKAGLTETLADRCAYLVASNIKQRKELKSKFKKLYKTRSKLVHGTVNNLNEEDMEYFHWGKMVLDLAIFKEIEHLGLEGNIPIQT